MLFRVEDEAPVLPDIPPASLYRAKELCEVIAARSAALATSKGLREEKTAAGGNPQSFLPAKRP